MLSVLRGFSLWDDQGQVSGWYSEYDKRDIQRGGSGGRRELQSSRQPSSNPVARKYPLGSPSDSSSFAKTSLPPSYVSLCGRRPPTSSPPGKRSRDGCRSGACHSSSSSGTAAIPTSISPSESVDNAFRVDNAMHHPLTRGVKTGSVISVPEALGLAFGTPMEMCVAVPNEQRTCECILSSQLLVRSGLRGRECVGVHHHSHTGVKHTFSERRTTSSRPRSGTRLSSQK